MFTWKKHHEFSSPNQGLSAKNSFWLTINIGLPAIHRKIWEKLYAEKLVYYKQAMRYLCGDIRDDQR